MPDLSPTDLIQKLETLGLDQDQAKIYLALADGAAQTVVKLSRLTGFPRSTIYDDIQKLSKLGLVESIVGFKTSQIKISSPEALTMLIEKRRADVEVMSQITQEVQNFFNSKLKANLLTKVKYYHGSHGLQQMMWNALSAEKEIVGYSEFGRIEIVGEKFQKSWLDEFHLRKLHDRAITNPRPESLKYIQSYVQPKKSQLSFNDIRQLPEKVMYISGDTSIYNNTYAVCYWRQTEVVGFEIENEEFVRSQKTMFETFWKLAKPIR